MTHQAFGGPRPAMRRPAGPGGLKTAGVRPVQFTEPGGENSTEAILRRPTSGVPRGPAGRLRLRKCHGFEIDLGAIAVRQLRIRRSHKINMSREVRPYTSSLFSLTACRALGRSVPGWPCSRALLAGRRLVRRRDPGPFPAVDDVTRIPRGLRVTAPPATRTRPHRSGQSTGRRQRLARRSSGKTPSSQPASAAHLAGPAGGCSSSARSPAQIRRRRSRPTQGTTRAPAYYLEALALATLAALRSRGGAAALE
jgi:hypothetical protein